MCIHECIRARVYGGEGDDAKRNKCIVCAVVLPKHVFVSKAFIWLACPVYFHALTSQSGKCNITHWHINQSARPADEWSVSSSALALICFHLSPLAHHKTSAHKSAYRSANVTPELFHFGQKMVGICSRGQQLSCCPILLFRRTVRLDDSAMCLCLAGRWTACCNRALVNFIFGYIFLAIPSSGRCCPPLNVTLCARIHRGSRLAF